ncbi:S41 family peptidase [Flavobacterium sp. N1736]|uniref:S41 family peptidase n=1 Tax=Flavobacterium sp. N1736 TaxID=2986823 RepID=UPI002224EC17|nr:S41 family peptidase [Flavobacterium sp. N1736]
MIKKTLLLIVIFSGFNAVLSAQNKAAVLKLNHPVNDLIIKKNEEQSFNFNLKKDTYYSIIATQQGIDLVVALKDKAGKTIQEVDSPNGMFGPEKIVFSPENSDVFSISVKPLNEDSNAQEGKYSIVFEEISKTLKKLSYKALIQDFDILQNAYYETHIGLWYNTRTQFDSICNIQKSKIKDKMNALDFYRILAPVVAFTKEGHCNIKLSDEIATYFKQSGTYLPFCVKIIDKKVYLLNDIENNKTKGFQISKINGENIDEIVNKFLSIEPADGFNITSKYRWIEKAFSRYYTRYYDVNKVFNIELINPVDNQKIVLNALATYNYKDFNKLYNSIIETIPNYDFKESATFSIDEKTSTATLTVNTFNLNNFKDKRKGFQDFLAQNFKTISEQKIKHLIIDIRKNEGGEQGMEDHLLSYLINQEYAKYKYVEIPGFTYSFIDYTDYKDQKDGLVKELKEDFYRTNDGRFLNQEGHYVGEKPNPNNFKGDIYILISGLTFSGGSEFAALAKNYTNAAFIGEETGGGYYGNSSGSFLKFTLPNSKITGRIPLCKFVIADKNYEIPFGHGIIPDYSVQPTIEDYLKGNDPEMNYVKKLILNKTK